MAANSLSADWTLTDPGADRVLGWDESNTGSEVQWFTLGTGLTVTGTTIAVDIGSAVQAYDADLTTYAGITPSANVQTFLGAADYAAMKTQLALTIGTNVQAYDADLTTYAGITPSANVQSLLGAADYAAMKVLLGLVIGTNVQAYDADLDTASTAGAAAVSTYFGKNAAGDVGFHVLPDAELAFTIDAPGASGALLQSNGTKWERVTSLTGMTFGGFTASKMIESDGSGNLTASSFAPADVALATGDTYSGVHDFGGATSIEIVNGSSPTVDAAGEIAIDTTSDQLIYYGGAKRVVTYKKQKDFVIKTPADADDFILFKAQTAITITDIHCIAQGGTSISMDVQECDSAGANCATVDAAITCDTDGAEDDGTLSNGTIDAGDWVKIVLGAPSGTVNFLTGSIYYVETAD